MNKVKKVKKLSTEDLFFSSLSEFLREYDVRYTTEFLINFNEGNGKQYKITYGESVGLQVVEEKIIVKNY